MVPVGRVALSPLCADEVLEGPVQPRRPEQAAPPDVALGGAAAAATVAVGVAFTRAA